MIGFLANITLNQIAVTATIFEMLKSAKNALIAMMLNVMGRYERQTGHFNPQDLDPRALTDEEQHNEDRREQLLQLSKTGLCLLTAYNLASGKANPLEIAVATGCIVDTGAELIKFAYRKG